ncbi:MAG: hypothetical protein AVDCRST_MAG41-3903, partial [uncultured Corynebacteriales bacterium]
RAGGGAPGLSGGVRARIGAGVRPWPRRPRRPRAALRGHGPGDARDLAGGRARGRGEGGV